MKAQNICCHHSLPVARVMKNCRKSSYNHRSRNVIDASYHALIWAEYESSIVLTLSNMIAGYRERLR